MSKMKIVGELWEYLKENKLYWLAPIVIVVLLLSMLMFFAQTSTVAPFIYTLF